MSESDSVCVYVHQESMVMREALCLTKLTWTAASCGGLFDVTVALSRHCGTVVPYKSCVVEPTVGRLCYVLDVIR